MAAAMVPYPPLGRFPEVEDAGWAASHEALRGRLSASEAVAQMQHTAEDVLGEGS